MPILNIQLGGEGQKPDGTKFPIPPQLALLQRGPIVQVSITVGTAIAQQVLQTGGSVPHPVSGLALIDTGATSTCVDDEAAKQLKLPAIDVVTVASASHSSTQQNVYPIQIEGFRTTHRDQCTAGDRGTAQGAGPSASNRS